MHGRVHCDPHAANMLIRRGPTRGKPQLVLLDHGLYRSIPADLRLSYCKLWRAIITGDEYGIKKHSSRMNAVRACVRGGTPLAALTPPRGARRPTRPRS